MSNSKKTWQLINKIRGKQSSSISSSFMIDNERIVCRRVIANKFNSYFINLAGNLNDTAYNEIPISSYPSFKSYLGDKCDTNVEFSDCSKEEVESIIKHFESGKSSDIPIILIKKCSSIISQPLSTLYNKLMKKGDFPQILKVGKITPIHKKGNKELLENYRPISTLPILGKIYEKIIFERLYEFFVSQGTLSESQFGFRKSHSTSHAIHRSVDIISEAHSKKKHVIGVFIDLSKAFDTLDHSILLNKLDNSGVRGKALKLLSSYLTDRRQFTSISGYDSEEISVKFGVPQGSVLGPLLFVLYINSITNCYHGTECHFVLYADDTNIFIVAENKDKAIDIANKVLACVSTFMKSNMLHINLDKCCFMYFEPPCSLNMRLRGSCARSRVYRRKADTPKVFIGGKEISEVTVLLNFLEL